MSGAWMRKNTPKTLPVLYSNWWHASHQSWTSSCRGFVIPETNTSTVWLLTVIWLVRESFKLVLHTQSCTFLWLSYIPVCQELSPVLHYIHITVIYTLMDAWWMANKCRRCVIGCIIPTYYKLNRIYNFICCINA